MEFLLYPQVIPAFCNTRGFGPPLGITLTSTCSWLDHSVSGLQHCTKIALLRLAFASAPCFPLNLAQYHNSPAHSAKGTLSPVNGLELFVSTRFQNIYFTPLPGFFSPFPHGTCSLSVIREYLALRDGPRGFRQNFTCSVLLRIHYKVHNILHTGLSPSMDILSRIFCYTVVL